MSSRRIVITGASGKVGRVLTQHFLSTGDQVVAVGRSPAALQELVADAGSLAARLTVITLDLMSPTVGSDVVAALALAGIRPDCLINNARSISYLRIDRNGFAARQDFLDELTLDVVVPYELTNALALASDSQLRAVVNIGSQYGIVAANSSLYENPITESPIQYSVAKAALAHLSREQAVRLAPRGVRVNCVAFGGVEGRVNDQFKERYARLCPSGRMLAESELAGPVDMLLSDSASGVTGHVMVVDGGWSVW